MLFIIKYQTLGRMAAVLLSNIVAVCAVLTHADAC
jgi:hypothetical protein